MDTQGAELLFQAISDRYECGTIVVTANRTFRDRDSILNNDGIHGFVAIDHLIQHGELVQIKGGSYRIK